MGSQRLPFIWDYDITEEMARNLLAGPDIIEKDWLIARIMEYAPWQTIWKYLDRKTIREHLDHLPLKPAIKNHWDYALKRWESTTTQTF